MSDLTIELSIIIFFCWLLLSSAVAKFRDVNAYIEIIGQFNIPGINAKGYWVWLLIIIELFAVLSLLLSTQYPLFISVPIAIFALYFVVIAVNLNPSSTVMIEQFPDKNSIDLKYNTDQLHISTTIKNIVDDFNKE